MKLPIVILLFGLSACSNQEVEERQIDTWTNRIDESKEIQKGVPITVPEIKSIVGNSVTSGVAQNDSSLCYPKDSGFLGFYFLLDISENARPMGVLNVWTPNIYGWKYSDKDEEFVRLEINRGEILLWSKVGIGTSKKELKEFIGKDFNYLKGTILHHEIDGYSIDYRILTDTVNSYIVTKECPR